MCKNCTVYNGGKTVLIALFIVRVDGVFYAVREGLEYK